MTKSQIFNGVQLIGKPVKVDNNTWQYYRPNGEFVTRHMTTDIIVINHDHHTVHLHTGGWKSVTTKDRMNKFSPFNVYQRNHKWFVITKHGDIPFTEDSIKLTDPRYAA